MLKALYDAYDAAGVYVTQLALAGRAAKRMQEATGRVALTIASFLGSEKHELDERNVAVVDEASMVDIITMNRLCNVIGAKARLVLVGDPAQLMPVGPGLVLHALMRVSRVPSVELTVVKRYAGKIASAAKAIRDGIWPDLSSDPSEPIAFIRAGHEEIPAIVLDLYRQSPNDTKILCARRRGPDGSVHLNALCQSAMTANAKPIRVWSIQHQAFAITGLRIGDPLLCTRNLWDRGLQNGSLGVVTGVEEEPLSHDGKEVARSRALATVSWDNGALGSLTEEMLDDVQLGYAITVHKAQGSQWPRVIVPLTGHRLLDRTLVYTAVTRAQRQVLLIGDAEAVRSAVVAEPRAQHRQVSLDLMLQGLLGCDLMQSVENRCEDPSPVECDR